MLFKISEFGTKTAVLLSGMGKRSLAVIACVSFLAGCESLPTVPSFSEMKTGLSEAYDETVSSIDKAWNDDPAAAENAASKNGARVSLDRAAVKRLQIRLAKHGYRSGPADGLMGAQTAKAIKGYQRAHRFPVTGKVSQQFIEHLEANTATADNWDMLTNSPN